MFLELASWPQRISILQKTAKTSSIVMTQNSNQHSLTRHQEKLIDASAAIQASPPEHIDFLHSAQCQCGIPYRNPGDGVREWERKQGRTSLQIEAGSAIDPRTGEFVKLGLPYGEKPRLVLIYLASESVRTGQPEVDVEESMTSFARSLGLETNGHHFAGSKISWPAWQHPPFVSVLWKRGGRCKFKGISLGLSICGFPSRPINACSGLLPCV